MSGMVTQMTKDFIRCTGRRVTLTFPDGTETDDVCVIQPLRYKNKMYMEGVGTDLGRERDSYYSMFAPPGFLPPGDPDGHYLRDGHFAEYAIIRRDTVYKGDEPVYDWAVLIGKTGGTYIAVQPVSDFGSRNGTVTFTVSVADETAVIKWYRSSDGGVTWTEYDVCGASLTVPVNEENVRAVFRCSVTNRYGRVFSDTVRILFVENAPEITEQPADISVNAGESGTFRIDTAPVTVYGRIVPIGYRWQTSGDNGETWRDLDAPGADGPALTLEARTDTASVLYRCAVSDIAGTAYSGSAMLTLADAPPVIMVQPPDVYASVGDTVSIRVIANGAASWQWQISGNGGRTWQDTTLSGNKTRELTFLVTASRIGKQYRCACTNANGTAYSAAAEVFESG